MGKLMLRHGVSLVCLILAGCGSIADPPTSSDSDKTVRAVPSEGSRRSDFELERLRAAVEQCGGTLRLDPQGRVVEVDLATERVSANTAAWDALRNCTDVKSLRIRPRQPTAQQLSNIATLTGLEALALRDTVIDDDTLVDIVAGLPLLRRLTLHNASALTDHAITTLARRTDLAHLALIDLPISGHSLKQIALMSSLTFLDLRMCQRIRGDDFSILEDAPKLEELRIGGAGVDNATLATLATFPHLGRLSIEDAAIDGSGIASLAKNRSMAMRLESLSLVRCTALTDDSLRSLGTFRNLRQLTLRDMPITGAFLQEFPSGSVLERLSMNQTFLSEEAFAQIAKLENLKRLELVQSFLSHSAMEHIGTLTKLEYLDLSDCSISDDFLAPLAKLRNLETLLVVGNSDVSQEAVAKLLERKNHE